MNTHDKGLKYCKVCKKTFDEKDHLVEHEDSHITSGKRYNCTEKLPNDTLCSCQCKVTWETLKEYKACIAAKEPVGTYQVTDAPQKKVKIQCLLV